MSKEIYEITGNTFVRKSKIRAAGGKWDAAKKVWIAELYKSDSLFRYDDLVFTVAAASDGSDFGYQESADSEGLED